MKVILALETSCDDTSAAVVVDGVKVLANQTASQVMVHQPFGGVVPEIASRRHLEAVTRVVDSALQKAGLDLEQIDAVAVTHGPGLVGSLLVGVSIAKALAYAMEVPLIAVHHLRSHLYAGLLAFPGLELPALSLIVSGGHTFLVDWLSHDILEVIGRSRDDAAGEAFDKVARILGLGYPGGPLIEKLAAGGSPQAVRLPRAWLEPGSLDFSFSGLKTAARKVLDKGEIVPEDLAASFQAAVVEVLVAKTIQAAKDRGRHRLVVAGGVAANGILRQEMESAATRAGMEVVFPLLDFCTDNAAMVGCAAYFELRAGRIATMELNAIPNLPLS